MRNPRYTNSFKLTIHDDLIPTLKWSKKRFISAEPLLGSLKDLNLTGIHWLIAGGESGRKARPMDGEWVQELRDKCHDEKTAFFFKQWGVTNKKKAGRELDGREWMEFPQES